MYYFQSFWTNQPRVLSLNDYNLLKLYYPVEKMGKTDNLIIYAGGTKMQTVMAQENAKRADIG